MTVLEEPYGSLREQNFLESLIGRPRQPSSCPSGDSSSYPKVVLGLPDTPPSRPHQTRELGLCLLAPRSRTLPQPSGQLEAGWEPGGGQPTPSVAVPSRGSSSVQDSFPVQTGHHPWQPAAAALSPSLFPTAQGALPQVAWSQSKRGLILHLGRSSGCQVTLQAEVGGLQRTSKVGRWMNPESKYKPVKAQAHGRDINITSRPPHTHFGARGHRVMQARLRFFTGSVLLPRTVSREASGMDDKTPGCSQGGGGQHTATEAALSTLWAPQPGFSSLGGRARGSQPASLAKAVWSLETHKGTHAKGIPLKKEAAQAPGWLSRLSAGLWLRS